MPPAARPWYVRAVSDATEHRDQADRLITLHGVDTVTAVLRPMLTDDRIQRIEAVLDARMDGLTAAIEDLHDPHNGAAAIRSLEAFGISTLHVTEAAEEFRFSPAVTIGCEKWIDIARHPDFPRCAQALRAAGFALYAACPDADLDIDTIDVHAPAAVIFGNEHRGLTDQAIALCDHRISIPMHGFTRSFNLSVSVAVTMHRLAARRRQALGRPGDLDARKRDLLRARWYALTVRGAEAILARYVSRKTQAVRQP